ncbi:MAG TPA: hypothetical protein VN829_16025 [Dongiaceae bacterium]|nr:hypothetical protein [Dongiaceae bacterium]
MTNDFEERRRLADEIIAASGAMPDAERHRLWLIGLELGVLRERLAQLRSEGWRTPGPRWMETAMRKAGIRTAATRTREVPSPALNCGDGI